MTLEEMKAFVRDAHPHAAIRCRDCTASSGYRLKYHVQAGRTFTGPHLSGECYSEEAAWRQAVKTVKASVK